MNLGYRTIDVYKRYAAPKDEILNALEAQIRSLEKPDSWGTPPVKELKIQRTIHGLKINMQAPILGTHPPEYFLTEAEVFANPRSRSQENLSWIIKANGHQTSHNTDPDGVDPDGGDLFQILCDLIWGV
jgi:hypothetical protein